MLKAWLKEKLGLTEIRARLERLEMLSRETQQQTIERSKARWREAAPDCSLTWDKRITGAAFVSKAAEYGIYGPDKCLLEIGPGYGRLLRSALEAGVSFKSYTGVDISERNVEFLTASLSAENIAFITADCELADDLGGPYDSVVSSLTLKHLYPTMQRALANVWRFLKPGARLCFDVIEGEETGFSLFDGKTYMKQYTRDEIEQVLAETGYKLLAFDEVEHAKSYTRLLVVAERGAD